MFQFGSPWCEKLSCERENLLISTSDRVLGTHFHGFTSGALNYCAMTPADLSLLLKESALQVFESHDLDTSVLPEAVTVERPHNPEHGDYATNVALQGAKKAGEESPESAECLKEAVTNSDAIDVAE